MYCSKLSSVVPILSHATATLSRLPSRRYSTLLYSSGRKGEGDGLSTASGESSRTSCRCQQVISQGIHAGPHSHDDDLRLLDLQFNPSGWRVVIFQSTFTVLPSPAQQNITIPTCLGSASSLKQIAMYVPERKQTNLMHLYARQVLTVQIAGSELDSLTNSGIASHSRCGLAASDSNRIDTAAPKLDIL